MPHEIVGAIVPLTAMVMLGLFGLLGLKMWFSYRVQRLSKGGADEETVKRLDDAVRQMQDQVQLLRDDQSELHERLDFAERLLTRKEREGLPGE